MPKLSGRGTSMRIELTCAACGKNRFAFPEGGDDGSNVVCEDCGHLVGTMGALKEAVAQAVIQKRRAPRIRKKVEIDYGR